MRAPLGPHLSRLASHPRRVVSAVTAVVVSITAVACASDSVVVRSATSTTALSTTATDAVSSTTSPDTGPPDTGTPGTESIATVPLASSTTSATTTNPPVTTAPSADLLALDLLAAVVIENEYPEGYDRDLFGYPKSFGGGCNTRTQVLRRDSLTPAQVDPFGCTVTAGDWYSLYDGVMHQSPADLEIDHVVALKEAWDSGAWRWDRAVMIAFANDLADPRTLRAVTTAVNRSKSDKDPSNWLPPNPNDVCRYAAEWVAIKLRWGLSMDQSEHARLRTLLSGQCAGTRVAPPGP